MGQNQLEAKENMVLYAAQQHQGEVLENVEVVQNQDHDYLGPQNNVHGAPLQEAQQIAPNIGIVHVSGGADDNNEAGAANHAEPQELADPNVIIEEHHFAENPMNMDQHLNASPQQGGVARNMFGVGYNLEDIFGNEEVPLIPEEIIPEEIVTTNEMEYQNETPESLDDNYNPGHVLNAALNALMNANRRDDLFEKLSDRITFNLPHLTVTQRLKLEELKNQYSNIRALFQSKPEREQEVYSCIKCNKTVLGLTALKNHSCCCIGFNATPLWMKGKHVYFHRPSNKKPHPPLSGKTKCPLCRRVYPSAILLKAHMRTYGINFCPILGCGKQFATFSKHNIHLGSKHSLNIDFVLYKCPACSQRFPTIERLTAHCFTHIKKKYHCPHSPCTEVFSSLKMMITHLKTHHPYICEACKIVFDDLLSYICHRRSHSPFHCNLCDKKFVSYFHFKKHRRICKSIKKRDHCILESRTRSNEMYHSLVEGVPLENQHQISSAECVVCFYISNNPCSVIVGSCLNGQHSASAG